MEDQYPVIHIQGQYFTMSLRMMKAVWYFFPPSLSAVHILFLVTRYLPGEACVFERDSSTWKKPCLGGSS